MSFDDKCRFRRDADFMTRCEQPLCWRGSQARLELRFMPIHYSVDSERQLIQITYLGTVTKDDIVQHRHDLENDPRGIAGYDALIDLTASTSVLPSDDVRELARFARAQPWPSSRRAIVSASTAQFGSMRMFEMLAESGPRQYRVFRSADEARDWLRVGRGDESAGSP